MDLFIFYMEENIHRPNIVLDHAFLLQTVIFINSSRTKGTMPAGKHKSGRFRKVKVRTPGGETVTHHRARTPKQPRCAITGEPLNGVPRGRQAKLRNLPKSKKRPQRPYGGALSSRGMRFLFTMRAREEE